MTETLYKYRSLNEFKYFVDIILLNRLFAAEYNQLNDPMEGQFYYLAGELERSIRNKLLEDKGGLKVCSLSKVNDNHLMWSHYADGHKGVAIGVRIDDQAYQVRNINYHGLAYIRQENLTEQTAIDILSCKLEVWNYEQEVRVFIRNKKFFDVEVIELITGLRMSHQDFSLVRQLVDSINPGIRIIKAETILER